MAMTPFEVSLANPLDTASGTIESRRGFLVDVSLDGSTGVGEATPLPGWTESVADCESALETALTALAAGTSPTATLADVDPETWPAARHGLACALADARASAAGVPLWRYLREQRGIEADAPESMPVNATIGDDDPTATADAAENAVASGFESLKVKVGARSVADDAARLRAVRNAVGPAVELRADANGAWTRSEATDALDAFAGVDLAYVEQPLPPDDLAAHARLRTESAVPVALDESLATASVDDVLRAAAADLLVCKPMVLGGPDRAVEIGLRALDAGLDVVVTTTVDAVVARTAAVHVAAALPAVRAAGLATADLLADDLAPDPTPVESGEIAVPEEKGLGLSVPGLD
jgi:o-succinylbenzoate synthase